MEEKLQARIQSKTQALMRLTQQLNQKEDDVTAKTEELDRILTEKTDKVFKRVAELERRLQDPKKAVTVIRDELSSKEGELNTFQNELNTFADELTEGEAVLESRESDVREFENEVSEVWTDAMTTLQAIHLNELTSVRKRAEMLEKRSDMLKLRQNRLNDQMRSLRAAKDEILGTNNG